MRETFVTQMLRVLPSLFGETPSRESGSFIMVEGTPVGGMDALLRLGPVLLLAVWACLCILATTAQGEGRRKQTGQVWPWMLSFVGLLAASAWQLMDVRYRTGAARLFGGTVVVDGFSRMGVFLVSLIGALAMVLGAGRCRLKNPLETSCGLHVPGLLLLSLSGMSLALVVADLLALVLCLEVSALPLIWLTGESSRSRDDTLRAYLSALFSATLLLWGALLVQKTFGATDYGILAATTDAHMASPSLAIAVVLLTAAFAWKLSAVPFDLGWARTTAQAPSPVALLADGAMKVALALVGVRLFVTTLGHPVTSLGAGGWTSLMASLAAVTFVVAGTAVLPQRRMVRITAQLSLLAAGWVLLGLVGMALSPDAELATMGLVYLVVAHGLGLAGVLALSSWIEGHDGPRPGDKVGLSPHWKALGAQHPFLAVVTCVVVADLLGFPLTMGFWARLAVVEALLAGGSSTPLLLTVVAGWVTACLVLIRVVKALLFPRKKLKISLLSPEDPLAKGEVAGENNAEPDGGTPAGEGGGILLDESSSGARLLRIVVGVSVLVVVAAGIWPEPFLQFFGRL
jgi:NADH:ubiquinone oxidoreductase subunit 2 (subunit N)